MASRPSGGLKTERERKEGRERESSAVMKKIGPVAWVLFLLFFFFFFSFLIVKQIGDEF